MNRKQKIIVSVTGIFIVLLILVGLTYAYFLTNIRGNTNTKSIEVTTANLILEYGENTNVIQGVNNAEPGYSVTKYFTATNNGNASVDYVATLDSVVNELTRQGDLEYILTCASYLKTGFSLVANGTPTGTIDGTCNGVDATQFPSTTETSIMVGNRISTTQVHYYVLTINYKEMGVDQSDDMDKTFSALVNIKDIKTIPNPYQSNTELLSYNIINNALTGANGEAGSKFVAAPLTKPAEETSAFKYIKGPDPSTYSNTQNSPGNYYITYADNYSIDEDTGKFTLTNPSATTKYSDISDKSTLLGKYIAKYPTTSSESQTTINLDSMYQISKISSEATTSLFKYAPVSKGGQSLEKVLSVTPDDYGNSYYFRGGVEDNYLNYSGMCWRIVRIEGDGSIKLILADPEGVCSTASTTLDEDSASIGTGSFSELTNSSSTNQTILYKFLIGESYDIYNYQDDSIITKQFNPLDQTKLKTDIWCTGDSVTGYNYSNGELLSDAEKQTEWAESREVYFDVGKRLNFFPTTSTLKCNGDSFDSMVGILTADEIAFAGGSTHEKNYGYYLINNATAYNWIGFNIMSASNINGYVSSVGMDGNISSENVVNETLNLRVSVTLISETEISAGDGTLENPYELR